ncbi:hypothetical protein NKR23_g4186 [Pleurostoma richardsiae]|uniref:Uncharacterized protein n=1 Tax=Pleurostoma richardsiae TaxID=41990 RepID=A0AA38RKN1_9PEZI|nr:hypothetical protein NKR23_g4186 [Pleurostoma richardsiae]
MRPTTFLLAVLAPLVSGFHLPANLPDGIYVAYYNSAGDEVHQPATLEIMNNPETYLDIGAPPAAATAAAVRSLRRADPWRYVCGCGFNMNHGDCDYAVEELKKQCDRADGGVAFVPPGLAWYSIHGGVVAFICNPHGGGTVQGIGRSGLTASYQHITDQCGWYVAGTYWYGVDPVGLDVGYMIYYSGLDFCAHAEGSSRTSC